HLAWGLRQVQYPFEQLLISGRPESLLNESMRPQIEHWQGTRLDEARRSLAQAVLALNADRSAEAEILLAQAREADPELGEVQARLGSQLARRHADAEFVQWRDSLANTTREHPGVWTAFADWLRARGDKQGALGCYLQAIARDPNQRSAVYQAGQLLIQLGKKSAAGPFLDRVRALDELQVSLEIIANERTNLEHIEGAAKATESLGRLWEAQGWYGYLVSLSPGQTAKMDLERVRARIRPDLPQTIPEANPSTVALRSAYTPPASLLLSAADQHQIVSNTGSTNGAGIRFTNASVELGIEFRYFNDHDPQQTAMRMQESMGGGVLALDYDLDGWPDIYATQGCQWPPDPSRMKHLDKLFRNRNGHQFLDVSTAARLNEWGFSQGGTAGDFDNDGFPDLYIGNAGPNVLFQNQGDGTFTEITTTAGVAGDEWTTSCAMCDLNQDGLPDLFAVGYLGGDNVYSLICHDSNGIPRSCKPIVHPPAIDRLFLNLGNGQFEDVSDTVAVKTGGRGLGIVIADFDGAGKPHIFIANDAEPNFYFVNQTAGPGRKPEFSEQALAAGLALNEAGRSQASMGVAAGDVDGNRLLDLLVTNYYHEGSTLYLQTEPNLFTDATRAAKLYEPSINQLGFGTQFLDADLDGKLDLVVGNGHEGNYVDLGVPFEMSPQFFHNLGGGQFSELHAEQLGSYFKGKYLARGLTRLDWNRDGRADFAVSHLDAPLALVRNESTSVGHWVGLSLHGVQSSRDAIGATVEADTINSRHWQQLVGGDGYYASNDRRMILGLGSADRITKLTIRWPSGVVDQYTQEFPSGTDWICVEGRPPVEHVAPK
ncbi:MAG: tetratricopeptide repeat protein, partial [Planctomycetaceae bacterium]|nr:tetratricopeptide repeat protein [Planctomycetaceae bacterium]